jgi:hypothetical protein
MWARRDDVNGRHVVTESRRAFMDPRTFDHMIASVVHQRTRRATVRVLAGGLLGGFLVQRGTTPTWAAAQADGDGDGL